MKFFRLVGVIATVLCVSSSYADAPIVTKIIDRSWAPNWSSIGGAWHFDEMRTAIAAGGTDFQDASGKGNNAVRKGGVTLAKTGKLGNALSLDGQAGTYISLGTAPSLSPLGQQNFTVTLWFNGQNFQHSTLVARGGGGGAQGSFECYLDGDNTDPQLAKEIACSLKNVVGVEIGSVSDTKVRVTRNAWHQFAMTRAGTVLTLFLDGQVVGTGSISGTQVTLADFRVGGSATAPGFTGLVDELGIWNSALHSAQIYGNYLHQAGLVSDHAYPMSAYYLSVAAMTADPTSLQRALDTYHVVRLDPYGNYSSAMFPTVFGNRPAIPTAPKAITMKTGYKLYGIYSFTPTIIVDPGASEVVVSNLTPQHSPTYPNGLVFATTASPTLSTHDNLFVNLPVGLQAVGTNLENNIILKMGGGTFDNSTSGFFRNNRFFSAHGGYMGFLGNTVTPSYGNVFVQQVFGAPDGDGAYITNQEDISFINMAAEAWNTRNNSVHGAMFTTDSSVKMLRIFGGGGGNSGFNMGNTVFTGFYNISSPTAVILESAPTSWGNPTTRFTSSVNNGIDIGSPYSFAKKGDTIGPAAPGFTAYNNSTFQQDPGNPNNFDFLSYGAIASVNPAQTVLMQDLTTLTPANLASMRAAMITNAGQPRRETTWEKPNYLSPPDPAGPNWNANLAAQPDSTTYIQNLINSSTSGAAFLPPGKYYISAPLVIDSMHGLVGAGMDQTVIIAKNSTIDIIVPNPVTTKYNMILTDVTLQGGANGVRFIPNGTGNQLNGDMMFSNVAIRNMSANGIYVDGTTIDTVLFDHLYFINNAAGFVQRGAMLDVGPAYMDGVSYYRCQFINNIGFAIDTQTGQRNHGPSIIESLFQNNGAVIAVGGAGMTMINSDMINNAGLYNSTVRRTAMITSNQPVYILGSRFQGGPRAPAAFLTGGGMSIEGSTFTRAGAPASTTILGAPQYSTSNNNFYNNSAPDMAIGPLANISGFFFNNYFPLSPVQSYEGMLAQQGSQIPILTNRVTAPTSSQFLTGSPMQFQY